MHFWLQILTLLHNSNVLIEGTIVFRDFDFNSLCDRDLRHERVNYGKSTTCN